INTYYYNAIVPAVPPEQMEEAGKQAEEALKIAISRFAERWDNEWLPELRGYQDRWNAFDLNGATDEGLLAHLDWTLETFKRLWDIHFQVMIPALVAPSMFLDLYTDLIEGTSQMDAYKLMQGIDNNSLRAGDDLWALSRSAAGSDEITSLLSDTPTQGVMEALEHSDDGKSLIEGINAYLQKWGNRSDTVIELADPSWVEDPSILIDNLKAYLKGSDENPRDKWVELVAERERLVAEARDLISGYPEPVKQQFDGMLAAGQAGQRLNEDHNWWIDQQGNHQVRQVFLEFGNRLAAAGAIASRDDVFMLTGDEIIDSAKSGFTGDFKSAASERRAEMDKWAEIPAAPHIGTDYGPPPDNPVSRALGRFFGWGPPRDSDGPSDLITGTPGSSGKVTGTARVIIKLSDAGRLNKGDILVTATTSPPWTPLFATAGGIVTDTGGALSHCAIVAREYGIPATVGAAGATFAIKDGDRIEVDGDAGTVRIL
ncbi:MAG: hypothetical protein IIB25_09185, partial [Chloroflexi bacterium]|nr:hypothetical protein [Chloroflexota bacterium]